MLVLEMKTLVLIEALFIRKTAHTKNKNKYILISMDCSKINTFLVGLWARVKLKPLGILTRYNFWSGYSKWFLEKFVLSTFSTHCEESKTAFRTFVHTNVSFVSLNFSRVKFKRVFLDLKTRFQRLFRCLKLKIKNILTDK